VYQVIDNGMYEVLDVFQVQVMFRKVDIYEVIDGYRYQVQIMFCEVDTVPYRSNDIWVSSPSYVLRRR